MWRIIIRAVLIVAFGAAVLLVAGVWGETEIGVASNHLFLAGVFGTLGILVSLSYSLRKRLWKWGKLSRWLGFHEVAALGGTAIILLHTGLRVHNITGWLAVLLLLILCVSGIVGRYLHREINLELARRKKTGEDQASLSRLEWWRDRFRYWRKVHIPLTKTLAVVLLVHLIATAFYGGWHL